MSFYKLDNGKIKVAPNFVYGPNNLELLAENKGSYTYPVEGWYWFDSDAEAAAHFGQPVGVESAIEVKAEWRKFNDSIPVSISQQVSSSPVLMMRLMRLELGAEFNGVNDKLIEYWGLLDKGFITAELRTQLNALAEACNVPIRLNDSGEMVVV